MRRGCCGSGSWGEADDPAVDVRAGGRVHPMVDRRTFLAGAGAVFFVAPLAAEAQQKVARIGYLAANLAANPHFPEAFRQGLRDLRYVEGQNILIEYRSAEGQSERLPALAAELVRLKVDVQLARAPRRRSQQSTRPRRSPSSSLLPPMRLEAGLSPVLRTRAATSRGCPSSPLRQSPNAYNCSRRSFRESLGQLSSGSEGASANVRKRTC